MAADSHPLRGTCNDPECPMHGLCHHCGRPSKLNLHTHRQGYTYGMPAMYLHGHHPATRRQLALGPGTSRAHIFARRDQAEFMARHLCRVYGGSRKAAAAAGIKLGTFRSYLHNHRHNGVVPQNWDALHRLFVASLRPRDPFAGYEPRRLPTLTEQRTTDEGIRSERKLHLNETKREWRKRVSA